MAGFLDSVRTYSISIQSQVSIYSNLNVKKRERETLSFNLLFFLFTSNMTGLLVAWLSTTPLYFATRLYWIAVAL